MSTNYTSIINKIDKLIKKHGIPYYLKKWKKPKTQTQFESYEDFIKYLNKYTRSYHPHSHVDSKILSESSTKSSNIKDRQLPEFKWDIKNKIGTIIFYHFYNGYDQTKNNKDTNKIIKLVRTTYKKWNKLGITGLIIDLRKHIGGNMWPHVSSLVDILGDTSLLSVNKIKTKFTDKKWTNIKDNKIEHGKKFLSNKLSFEKPIAIIVSKNTESSGEFIASIFYGRDNTKIFGDKTNKTGGYLSANYEIKINDDIRFTFTADFCTTVDGTFHLKEYISVDKKTTSPITDAKKWISLY